MFQGEFKSSPSAPVLTNCGSRHWQYAAPGGTKACSGHCGATHGTRSTNKPFIAIASPCEARERLLQLGTQRQLAGAAAASVGSVHRIWHRLSQHAETGTTAVRGAPRLHNNPVLVCQALAPCRGLHWRSRQERLHPHWAPRSRAPRKRVRHPAALLVSAAACAAQPN